MTGDHEGVDLEKERAIRIEAAMSRLRSHDAEWADMFRAYVLDGMYKREVLDHKTRELCAVAALTVLDRPGPLTDHMKGAFRHGATSAEVLEAVLQASVYGGFPVTLSAIGHLESVITELGIEDE